MFPNTTITQVTTRGSYYAKKYLKTNVLSMLQSLWTTLPLCVFTETARYVCFTPRAVLPSDRKALCNTLLLIDANGGNIKMVIFSLIIQSYYSTESGVLDNVICCSSSTWFSGPFRFENVLMIIIIMGYSYETHFRSSRIRIRDFFKPTADWFTFLQWVGKRRHTVLFLRFCSWETINLIGRLLEKASETYPNADILFSSGFRAVAWLTWMSFGNWQPARYFGKCLMNYSQPLTFKTTQYNCDWHRKTLYRYGQLNKTDRSLTIDTWQKFPGF